MILAAMILIMPVACAPPPDAEQSAGSPEEPVAESAPGPDDGSSVPTPEYFLTRDQTHNKFSRTIPPVLTVPSGAVVSVETEEATDGQLTPDSTAADVANVSFDPIHPLTGPIFVEGARPGDILKVTLHDIEVGDWGWTGVFPGFGFLAEEFPDPYLKTFRFQPGDTDVDFGDGVRIPFRPFPGVLGVAPDTDELLSTIPPRANGGNMDDKDMVEGTSIYLPVFVEGALFSIGDTHAVQGDGEVCGTALEAPMKIILQLEVLKGGRSFAEPQYESETHYSVTAFATTIDEAARKATGYMVDYLAEERGLEREDAYALASLAADLKIAEVVDLPHVLVTMTVPKEIFGER